MQAVAQGNENQYADRSDLSGRTISFHLETLTSPLGATPPNPDAYSTPHPIDSVNEIDSLQQGFFCDVT
jgi:hypothetical protein